MPFMVFAQNGSIWFFGGGDANGNSTYDAAGLDFSGAQVSPLGGGFAQISTFEGCATLSDNNGHFVLYTDGSTVFDRTHTPMPNGTGLYGSLSSTQSAIIGPVPGVTDQFYIFTNKSYKLSFNCLTKMSRIYFFSIFYMKKININRPIILIICFPMNLW